MSARRRRNAASPDDLATCMAAIRDMNAYLDGEITGTAQAALIAEHLEVCRNCGLEAQTLRRLKSSLQGMGPVPEPDSVDRLRRFARGLRQGWSQG